MATAIGPAGAGVLAPSFESGGSITYRWQTHVQKAWGGLEKRQNYVDAPQRNYKLSARLEDVTSRQLLSLLAGSAHTAASFLLGEPFEDLTVLSSSGVNVTVSDLSLCDWALPGQRVAVISPAGAVGTSHVEDTPGGGVVELADDLSSLAVFGARIVPAMAVQLTPTQGYSRHPVNLGELAIDAIALRSLYGDGSGEVGVGASVTSFDGLNVWDRGLLVSGTARQPIETGIELLNHGAIVTAIQVLDRSEGVRQFAIRRSDRAGWQWFKRFMHATRGAQQAFLLPTGRPDLPIVGDASTGTLVIDSSSATGIDYIGDWHPSLAHRRIKLVKSDGTFAYRTIESTADNGSTQDLVLDSSLAGALDHVEFLETTRLESDAYTVSWFGGSFSCDLSARVVQQ